MDGSALRTLNPNRRQMNPGSSTSGGRYKSRYARNGYGTRYRDRMGEGEEQEGLLRTGDAREEELDRERAVEVGEVNGRLGGSHGEPQNPNSSHSSSTKSVNKSRTIPFKASQKLKSSFPANIVRNQKYSITSFLPLVLYEQFKFFFNLYFLLVALSQFIPALKIGFIVTYVAPLAFVLLVTMGKEAFDDWQRNLRDREANSARYLLLAGEDEMGDGGTGIPPTRAVKSSAIRLGDLVLLEKDQRVPADMILLKTSDASGTAFVRTDQLDGETDWKLRVAVPTYQKMEEQDLLNVQGEIYADPPIKDIHTFVGTITLQSSPSSLSQPESSDSRPTVDPLTAENVLWANTVLAAGSAVGFVIYTGPQTRAVMNTSHPETKTGMLDLEINRMAKILCAVTFALSVLLVALNGFRGQWFIYIFRFLILFSSIIPISLRVNLDMGKTVYARQIENDSQIPNTIVRTSTLPEELGRIEYLLSDKTGTLTQNEMEMKKLHLGTMSYGFDSMDEVAHQLASAYGDSADLLMRRKSSLATGAMLGNRGKRDISSRVKDTILALALCHNVTPVTNEGEPEITYQASSPDEVAIVKFTESVGLTLISRDRTSITLRTPSGKTETYQVLDIFPFTSESKRMGILIRENDTGSVTFIQKGADVVMAQIVQRNDWLEEECGNMAREGLRTLVVGRKKLSEERYREFEGRYHQARTRTEGRNEAIAGVVEEMLERDLELLALTGVEDKLQEDVRSTLELLRNAGIKIWMLTGDKIETATCIAISSKLVARGQYIHQVAKLKSSTDVQYHLDFLRAKLDCCLVIDGESLQLCLDTAKLDFIQLATQLSCVVACRCSPTQKADVARLIRSHTGKRVCCIGDGGNDVSMIQAADVGLGIVGKEGKQASLAADFSITQFSFLTKLLLWHGRNSYKRSAKLAQFVIHRGLIISVMQAVFSAIFYFAPIALYQGWLQVGYATIYTMMPVFSLVLDRDVNEDTALLYPELYKELTKGRSLSYKTFFTWVLISVYQGGSIMIMSLLLFETDFLNIVSISFTALILNELLMVALEITTWHPYMVMAEISTFLVYGISMAFLPEYFDLSFVLSTRFIWKVALIVAVGSMPLYVVRVFQRTFKPETYAKLVS